MKGVFSWLLATAGLVVGIYFIPQLLTLALQSETPAAVVISRSMWPVLNRGDIIFIKKTTKEEVQVGTILIFRHGDGIAIHRVIRLNGDTIVTKGDANSKADEPITFEKVVGRLPTWWGREGKIPWIGKLVLLGRPEVSPKLDAPPAAEVPGMVGAFRRILGNPFALVLLVILPFTLLFALLAMEVMPRVGPGRRKRRWRQRRLERLRRRKIHTRFAFR